jgi:uncharacterized protein YgfB (UPF0149 family)
METQTSIHGCIKGLICGRKSRDWIIICNC